MNAELKKMIGKRQGRDSAGRVSVRQRGGGAKRFWRNIDFRRDKKDISAKVVLIENDPNRNVDVALVNYADGEKRYILAALDMKIGDVIIASKEAEIKPGNCLPLLNIPIGMPIHNLEFVPNKGGQIVRSAGSMAVILAKEENQAQVKLPSGELRLFPLDSWATIGQLANVGKKFEKMTKAGDARRRGKRPVVRGVAQNPHSHPHGGGEGRSGIGMPGPKSRWGKRLGKKTRKKFKYSDKFIIKRRK